MVYFFGAGDEEIAEAPPVADEARRFRGNAPIGGHDSGRESAGMTVSKSLAALPGRHTHTGTETCHRHVSLAAFVPFSSLCPLNQKITPSQRMVLFFGAGDEARTRYLDLGKVALYQMSYAREARFIIRHEWPPVKPFFLSYRIFFAVTIIVKS